MLVQITTKTYFGLDEIAALTANVRQKSKHVDGLNVSDLPHHAVKNNVCPGPTNASAATNTRSMLCDLLRYYQLAKKEVKL